jgi:hypothetical protein
MVAKDRSETVLTEGPERPGSGAVVVAVEEEILVMS